MKILFCLVGSLLLMSCTTFYQGDLQSAKDTEAIVHGLAPAPKKKIFLEYSGQWSQNSSVSPKDPEIIKAERADFVKVVESTGLFQVVDSSGSADETWKVEHDLREHEIKALGIICAVTLYIIPFWGNESFVETTLNVSDAKTLKSLYSSRREDHYTFVNQTLLVFLMPFNWSEPLKIRETAFRKSIESYLKRRI